MSSPIKSHHSHNGHQQPPAPPGSSVANALALITEAEQLLSPELHPALSTGARRRGVPMRRGGEKFAAAMAQLAASDNRCLRAFGFDSTLIQQPVDTVRALTPLVTRLEKMLHAVQDTLREEKGKAWVRALEVYRIAQRAAERDEDLAAEIGPWEQMFKHNSRKKTTKANSGQGSAPPNGGGQSQST